MKWEPTTPEQKAKAREAKKLWMRKWRAENPEKAKEATRKANQRKRATPERRAAHAARMRKHRKEHPDRERAAQRKYRAKPGVREKKAEVSRAWWDANKERKHET